MVATTSVLLVPPNDVTVADNAPVVEQVGKETVSEVALDVSTLLTVPAQGALNTTVLGPELSKPEPEIVTCPAFRASFWDEAVLLTVGFETTVTAAVGPALSVVAEFTIIAEYVDIESEGGVQVNSRSGAIPDIADMKQESEVPVVGINTIGE